MNQSKTINSNTGTGSAGTTGTSTSTSSTVLSASFSYDAFGRRIQSTITQGSQAPNTVQYLYEGAQALGEIRDGKLSHRLLTGLSLDETIARIAINADGNKDAANSRLYLTDALNSVIAQLADDDNANIQNSYAYSPYGQSQTVGPDSANNPNQYTSRENDNTGLYYYRARYYDPVLKRFVSSDPIGLAGGLNTYSYVRGSPVIFADPNGLDVTISFNGSAASGAGHVGISVNSPNTVGQRPQVGQSSIALALGINVPGQISLDPVPDARINIPLEARQDHLVQQCIDQRTREQQDYNLYENNCAQFVQQCLKVAGVPAVDTKYPRILFNDLRRRNRGAR
jgi:RHS repeat-associated protein